MREKSSWWHVRPITVLIVLVLFFGGILVLMNMGESLQKRDKETNEIIDKMGKGLR